jgi:ATP sulfurylase
MATRPGLKQLGLSTGKGRNVWHRAHEESMRFAGQLREILAKYPS